jgi:protoporphyrinogen oxidase
MTDSTHVVILGGGPAGVGGAYQLRRTGRARVTLLEAQSVFGGNATSFQAFGQYLDYGSHRLHHATDPAILEDIKTLLKGDLKDFPRHGRIRLRGKWLHFPLKPVDLMLRLDRGFAIGTMRDMVMRNLRKGEEGETFSSVLRANLGPTICNYFYFPYANKIWGREPDELSGISARKRVSAGSFKKILKRLVKPPGGGNYYYPRKGYGQITDVYAEAAAELGADLRLNSRVTRVERPGEGRDRWRIIVSRDGQEETIEADHIWSTIPTPLLARMMEPAIDPGVLGAAGSMQFRAMVLVYLQLDVDQFTTTDAHYFPERDVAMTRLSEPKNYWRSTEPKGTTTLCAEYPCQVDDELWSMSDEDLGRRLAQELERVGLPLARPPIGILVKRLRQAYPIYTLGYEKHFSALDEWAESTPNLLVYGRQGLFAHDNLHHALFMAYSAVDCLEEGCFNQAKWDDYRKIFETHVVED